MKKYLFIFTVFALLQVSCSSDDNEPGFKEDRVFQESQFLTYWSHSQTKSGDTWVYIANMCEKDFVEFKAGNVLNIYNCAFVPETGKWTFNGKNVIICEEKNGAKYQFNLIEISDTELITEVHINGGKETRKYIKAVSTVDDYYKYFTEGYKVKDLTNFIPMGVNRELNILAGLKDNKLWIGHFDAESKEQIYEKKDKEDFSFTKRIHTGYGQYETFNVNTFGVAEAYDNKLFKLNFYLSNEQTSYMVSNELWFTERGKIIDYGTDYFSVKPWYNNSYLVYSPYEDLFACLSEQGDSILSGKMDYHMPFSESVYPINYNYFISATSLSDGIYLSIERIANDANSSWNRNETKIDVERSDFKYAVNVLEKNSSIWKFKIDITEYSGKQHSHTVEIDVSGVK